MIKLYQFKPCFDLPNQSAFCMKVETFLRMSKLQYATVHVTDPGKLPKGKAPVIEDNGKLIADSFYIIEYLKRVYPSDIDASLNDSEKALAWAFTRMLEEHYNWILVYSRFIDERAWPTIKKSFFGDLPPGLRSFVPVVSRKKVQRALYLQGMGRHTETEILQLANLNLAHLSNQLAGKSFFMGETPTTVDATVYAFLANTVLVPLHTPLQEIAKQFDNFLPYCHRMRETFF